MHDRIRLRRVLQDALAAAQDARAPERILALLRGAYATLESARFVDADVIRWAEASLGAWRRWAAAGRRATGRGLLVVSDAVELTQAATRIAAEAGLGGVRVASSHRAALEALATNAADAILFDCDAGRLAPSTELLEWLATDLPLVARIGCARDPSIIGVRERPLYHALVSKPVSADALAATLAAMRAPRSSTG